MPGQSWSILTIPAMDCPSEEQLIRMALAGSPEVQELQFDLADRQLRVRHEGPTAPILSAIAGIGMSGKVLDCVPVTAEPGPGELAAEATGAQRRVLVAVLAINAAMFLVEGAAGLWADSSGLLADSVDMAADASVYAVALGAVGAGAARARSAARLSGWLQLVMAAAVLAEVLRRAITGAHPEAQAMMAVGALALLANVTCVVLLAGHRKGGAHLQASWIFTTNDALANAAVILAGFLVAATGSPYPDLVIGVGIAALVASGAWRILRR